MTLSLDDLIKLTNEGHKFSVTSKFRHCPDPTGEGTARVVEVGEVGVLRKVSDWDAPDYVSSWGIGMSVRWADFIGSYNDYGLVSGWYNVDGRIPADCVIDIVEMGEEFSE